MQITGKLADLGKIMLGIEMQTQKDKVSSFLSAGVPSSGSSYVSI